MWLLLWAAIAVFFFLVPMFWMAPRWGAPWPYLYRRRVRDRDLARAQEPFGTTGEDRWWFWADFLWVIWIILLVWLVVALAG